MAANGTNYVARYSDEEYLAFNQFQGEEADLTLRTKEIRTARKAHPCFGISQYTVKHNILPGERYLFEKARVDSSFWGEYKVCLSCMDNMIEGAF